MEHICRYLERITVCEGVDVMITHLLVFVIGYLLAAMVAQCKHDKLEKQLNKVMMNASLSQDWKCGVYYALQQVRKIL